MRGGPLQLESRRALSTDTQWQNDLNQQMPPRCF
jgi:hypothetical protein